MIDWYFRPVSFIGIAMICLGTGGIKPCVVSFGADQFKVSKLWISFNIDYRQLDGGWVLLWWSLTQCVCRCRSRPSTWPPTSRCSTPPSTSAAWSPPSPRPTSGQPPYSHNQQMPSFIVCSTFYLLPVNNVRCISMMLRCNHQTLIVVDMCMCNIHLLSLGIYDKFKSQIDMFEDYLWRP